MQYCCFFQPLGPTKQLDKGYACCLLLLLCRSFFNNGNFVKTSPYELIKLLENPKYEVGHVEMLTEELYAVPYRSLSDFAESHDKYNVVIGLYFQLYNLCTTVIVKRFIQHLMQGPYYSNTWNACQRQNTINCCIQVVVYSF